jgi:threonine dehydrogenase-like Zn-dependent dehydrogenase
MRVLVLERDLSLCRRADPVRAEGEAMVRVHFAGICGTDLELVAGYRGFRGTPGHEFVGTVEDASDPSWLGARVVAEINVACGRCGLCREGLTRHCERREVLGIAGRDGAFAERLSVPLENLHRVPEAISDQEAVFVEPLAAALGVLEAGMRQGDTVLVVGDGRLGALIALGLGSRGVRIELLRLRAHLRGRLSQDLDDLHKRECQHPVFVQVAARPPFAEGCRFSSGVQHVAQPNKIMLPGHIAQARI